jgi:hypothetical protein
MKTLDNKQLSEKSTEGAKAGQSGDGGGPTGSSRTYPKSKNVDAKADFNPMADKKRSGTRWAVGGV